MVVPTCSILLTIIIKISSKPNFITLGFIDYLDFGFDLSISSIIVLLTSINGNSQLNNTAGLWLLFFFFILMLITSIIVNRSGWNNETKQQNLLGVILPDIIGGFLLVLSTLYVGGFIQ